MPCHHPLPAWKTRRGEVSLGREPPDSQALRLPCGSCLGCRTSTARAWALRCHLELQAHEKAVFTTLTYAEAPPTLRPEHLQLWLKRLRKSSAAKIRFFASGEYGERFNRPHYHALLYGAGPEDAEKIEKTWKHGYAQTVQISPAAIAYVAGYCQKKIGYRLTTDERVDPETGELYTWQPPFRVMSRRPGIGGDARKWATSWRRYAVHNDQRIPVPRFLHEAWKKAASAEELEILEKEKYDERALRETQTTEEEKRARRAAEALAVARQNLRAAERKYE